MKSVVFVLTILGLLFRLQAAQSASSANYVEGEVIVTFKNSANIEEARRALRGHDLKFDKHFGAISKLRGKQIGVVRSPARKTADLITQLRNNPAVERAETNFLRRPFDNTPNDPLFPQLWALRNAGQSVNGISGTVGADIKFIPASGLARSTTNPAVVAVIDSGVDYAHPDLTNSMWINFGEIPNNGLDDDGNDRVDDYNGFDFSDQDGNPTPPTSHGTHVAGSISATGNNQFGVTGVANNARIMALKVASDADPSGFPDSDIIEAIDYAIMMKGLGANVVAINASWGGPDIDFAMEAAIQSAADAGIIFCAAAGNDGSNNDTMPVYPANYRLTNMIVVAASDQNDALANFSNYGAATVDVAAPGVNILSSVPTGLAGTIAFVRRGATTYSGNGLEYAGLTADITASVHHCGLGNPGDFPASVSNNIALIARGTLFFSEKVTNAIAAGARAAIIYNNEAGNFQGTLDSLGNWIPAVSISQADGLALLAALPTVATVVNTNDPGQIFEYFDGTSMATPHVAGAVALAAMNFPQETFGERIQRILSNVDVKAELTGTTRTGGRLNLQRVVDSDANSLPDWWEKIYFDSLTGTDPNADLDQDQTSNLAEWLAGTIPTNAASAFRILRAERFGNDMLVTWSTVGQHGYVLQSATNQNLSASNFDNVGAVIFTSGTSEGTTNYLHVGGATNPVTYYRVRLQ
jgi:subtilisin family serine protease